jgi:hypothetical protein
MNSSPGLQDLIKRHGYTPTGNLNADIKIAKKFMPAAYRKDRNVK